MVKLELDLHKVFRDLSELRRGFLTVLVSLA